MFDTEEDVLSMSHIRICVHRSVLSVLLLAACLVAPASAERPASQVGVDAGWARPYGDLAREYQGTALGFGAGEALQLGFFWRYHLSPTVALSPAFHFVDYRDFKDTDSTLGDYRISASSLRYTLELMLIQRDLARSVRPFLALSGGLYRDRVVGFNKTLSQPFDRSVNSLGFAVRGGVQVGPFELSAVYSVDRFSSWQFFQTGEVVPYNWDNFAVRAGWLIPFSY